MRLTTCLCALFFTLNAFAAQLAGVHLDDTLNIHGKPLALVSCGVRDTLWIDHYVAGLYVPPGASPQATRDPSQPKAVQLKVVSATYLPADIPEKWRGTLQQELAQEPMGRVRRAYDRLSDGDLVTFDYLPEHGVTMSINGKAIAHAPGHALIDAILDAWAGKDPISGKLQRLTLQNPC